MTGNKKTLMIGIAVGFVLALAVVAGVFVFEAKFATQVKAEPDASETAAGASGAAANHSGHQAEAVGEASAEPVSLSEEQQKQIGLQTAVATRRKLADELVTVARVEEAETRLASISARVDGRIEKLHVQFTGQPVRKGQAVATIYSPALLASAEEYRLALQSRERMESASAEAKAQADELVAAARRRLELWGVPSEQIPHIGMGHVSGTQLTTYATVGGVVMERKVAEGQYVREGDTLFTVADLSTVWVKADVFEADLARVKAGQAAVITSEADPALKVRGRVEFIEYAVHPETRTVPVRIQVANPGLRLRPGMFLQARIQAAMNEQVVVPRTAVLYSGERKLVYVAKDAETFEPREVTLGTLTDEWQAIVSGVKEGERVVTSGAFLLDSQQRMTGGASALYSGSKEFREGDAAAKKPNGSAPAAKLKITLESHPNPPKGAGPNHFVVKVAEADGKPVEGATVKLTLVMPAMPGMPEMRSGGELTWSGMDYSGMVNVPMAGGWNALVEVRRGGALIGSYRTQIQAK